MKKSRLARNRKEASASSLRKILRLSQSKDHVKRVSLLSQFSTRPKYLARVIALSMMHDSNNEVRCEAIDLLCEVYRKKDKKSLLMALRSPSWIVRHSAMLALIKNNSALGMALNELLLNDKHFVIRRDAVLLLGKKQYL